MIIQIRFVVQMRRIGMGAVERDECTGIVVALSDVFFISGNPFGRIHRKQH